MQMHCQLPVTLILSVAGSPHALARLLPLPAVACLRLHRFHLMSANARVESIFSEACLIIHHVAYLHSRQTLGFNVKH